MDWIDATATTVKMSWDPVDLAPGVPCTSYEVSWGTGTDAVGGGTAVTAGTNITITLPPNVDYYVKVRARDDANSGWSDWGYYLTYDDRRPVRATTLPVINGTDVKRGYRGVTVKMTGMNLGAPASPGTVSFGTAPAQFGDWKNNRIVVAVPQGAALLSNSITVQTSGGITATHIGPLAPYIYNVVGGALVFDDMEGGAFPFAVCDGLLGTVVYTSNYVNAPEKKMYTSIECTGTSPYEIFGGVTPYGNDATENGYDLSAFTKIKILFKGDGSGQTAKFRLVEADTAAGNDATNQEIYEYNVPISFTDTSWHEITMDLTETGTNKFVRDPAYYGNGHLDPSKIKAYQIYTVGSGGTKDYAIDYVVVTGEVGGTGSKTFTIKYNDETQNEDWVSVPFSGTTITNTDQLIQSVAAAFTPVAGDIMSATIRNNSGQTFDQGSMVYDGASWVSLSSQTIPVGAAIALTISNPGRPTINTTWTISGNVPMSQTYPIVYNDETQNENWVTNYNGSGITNTDQLIQSIAAKFTPAAGDIMSVTLRDNGGQSFIQGSMVYDGASWVSLSSQSISTYDPCSVVLSNPGRGTINTVWP